MNRADAVRALAMCEALAAELRANLNADARAEFEEQGCAPSWRLPGFTVSTAMSKDAVTVDDADAFLAYVAARYPTEVETVTTVRVREAWQRGFLADMVRRGEPLCDDEGTVVPGVRFAPGGEFRCVSVSPLAGTRDALRTIAHEISTGVRPLALPATLAVVDLDQLEPVVGAP